MHSDTNFGGTYKAVQIHSCNTANHPGKLAETHARLQEQDEKFDALLWALVVGGLLFVVAMAWEFTGLIDQLGVAVGAK